MTFNRVLFDYWRQLCTFFKHGFSLVQWATRQSLPDDQSPPMNPLAEVFGFPIDNLTTRAQRYRSNKLCPFNNKVPSCTKDKANDPLGVCSVFDDGKPVITCPVRFRQDWIIAEDTAEFFFPRRVSWTSLTEVKLMDLNGQSAGNIDLVLVSYDIAWEDT
jgi:hypothetical protein